MITKIISGGQTGADQAGLAAGKFLNLETGGTAPPDFRTETGKSKKLLEGYGLEEGKPDRSIYRLRTKRNILDSDGTVVFGDTKSVGSKLTINTCANLNKPLLINPYNDGFLKWIEANNISILNVAGNRESIRPGIYNRVYEFLVEALKDGDS